MKKIYNIVLAAVALIAFAPAGIAQEETTYENGIGYSKKISRPNDDGVYTITLEAFTTGNVSIKQVNQPADIVLVLDTSGSMSQSMGGQGSGSRLAALKTAVNAFIDQINTNDKQDDDGVARKQRLTNRIAIVTFSTTATVKNQLTYLGNSLTDNSGVTALKQTISDLDADGGTYAHRGMLEAYNLIKGLPASRKLRTVVLFTDGDPGLYANWTSDNWYYNNDLDPEWRTWSNQGWRARYRVDTYNTANKTITYANDIKNLATATNGIKSNVFTVSIINNPSRQTQVYLGKTSSNWLGATSMGDWEGTWTDAGMWDNGDGTRNTSSEINFALSATTAEDLKKAFETIGADAGGSAKELGEAASAVDIVSASFMLPVHEDGKVHVEDIELFTAKCTGGEEDAWTFASEVKAPSSNDQYYKIKRNDNGTIEWVPQVDDDGNAITIDDNLVAKIDSTVTSTGEKVPNRVSVEGFDFDSFFCHIENGQYKGYKLLIKIPVKMNPEAVGGPGVETNEKGSGLYADLDGDGTPEPVITYTPPQVDLPINIHIQKNGLKVGESAKFKIQRIDKATPTATNWVDVTTVFLTKTSETEEPLVKVRGLDPNFIYQIVEEDWSWSYTKVANTPTRSDLLKMNPFIFTNTPKTDIDKKIRHAESKATNDFSGSGSATYVDSKDNGR